MIVVTCSNPPENPPEKRQQNTGCATSPEACAQLRLAALQLFLHGPTSEARLQGPKRAVAGGGGEVHPEFGWWNHETSRNSVFFLEHFVFLYEKIYQPTAWFDLQTRGFYRDNNNILSSFFQQIVRVCVLTIFSKQKILVGSYQQHWIQPNWEGLCTPSRCIDTWARDWSNLKQPPPE